LGALSAHNPVTAGLRHASVSFGGFEERGRPLARRRVAPVVVESGLRGLGDVLGSRVGATRAPPPLYIVARS
jgi:hypothetical protein